MVYVDTLRPDWRMSQTAGRFFGTVLIATAYGLAFNDSRWMVVASALVVTKAAWSAISLLRQPLSYSSRMHRLALPRLSAARYLLALAAAFLGFVAPIPAMALALASELLERTLFFKTVKAWRMPGV